MASEASQSLLQFQGNATIVWHTMWQSEWVIVSRRIKLFAEQHHSPDNDSYIVQAAISVNPHPADQNTSDSWNFPAQPSDQFLIHRAYSTTETKGTGNVAICHAVQLGYFQ